MKVQGRSFLLLQGACSPFFQRLATRLAADGHRVVKVNFTGGDWAYWRRGNAYAFRGPLDALPGFLQDLWRRHGITDQLLFGDRRPVHRAAIEAAPDAGVRTHVFEEGYLRPHWITLEREGVNDHSLLPRDPDWYRDVGSRLPEPPAPVHFRSPFRLRATHDVLYHLAGLANPLAFPRYRTHAPITAPVEYAGYLKRFAQLPGWKRDDAWRIEDLVSGNHPYFVLPLQLDSDAQIRDHSPYAGMREVIDDVMGSFARRADPDARLVIKNHPLDMGLVNYPQIIARLSRRHGLEGRVVYLESGDLNVLLKRARGMVTVNSTAGLVALEHLCPTLTLSDPIYRLPGLTCQGTLDAFWQSPTPPDAELFQCFRKTLLHTVQINGGYYCRPGIELAVENAARVLQDELSPLERLLCSARPRLRVAS